MQSSVDVLILGGGPAGLSVALALCRVRHTCVVLDTGVYRNQIAQHMHSVPTWDHADPIKYRNAARAELTGRYDTVQFIDRSVSSVVRTEGGAFVATDADGKEWTGSKLVLATGVKDIYPEIPGYAECWVKGIFHCLYCHGYEETGSGSAGILAVGDLALAPLQTNIMARNALQFAAEVVVYTHGSSSVAEVVRPLVQKRDIKVDPRPIARLIKESEGAKVTIVFQDGTKTTHGFLVHKPRNGLDIDYARSLGLEISPSGAELKVTPPFNETTVKGCFAVGDMGTPGKVQLTGQMNGYWAAVGIVMQLESD